MKPSPDFPQPETWHLHRVYYGETDAMGVVYYANYLDWFEIARNSHLHAQGFSYAQIEAKGIFLPVREVQCRYYSPAKFDQLIYLRTAIFEWRRASFVFGYEVTDEAKTILLAKGTTWHACVDQTGKPVPVPKWLRSLFDH